jgi:hypothetical protein
VGGGQDGNSEHPRAYPPIRERKGINGSELQHHAFEWVADYAATWLTKVAIASLFTPQALYVTLRFAHQRRFGQGKEYNLFTGDSADGVVHTDDLDAGDFPNHGFHERSGCFEKMFTHLFEQIAPFFGRQRFDQVLFGRSQHALKTNKDNVVDQ